MMRRLRPGSILMECVLVFPLMLLLISMVLQFAHVWTARQITAYAAYCATRSIMAVPPAEQDEAAQKAAELACSWMTLIGQPGNRSTSSNETVRVENIGRLHQDRSVSDQVVVRLDDGAPLPYEVLIPGWGAIPGSDSVDRRVSVTVRSRGTNLPVAMVTVEFKFPLVLPLAGRMLSLFTNNLDVDRTTDHSYGGPEERRASLWYGESIGDETVLDEYGRKLNRKGKHWGEDGRYPFITLTETCVLPMPYSTANFPRRGYSNEYDRRSVADLIREGVR